MNSSSRLCPYALDVFIQPGLGNRLLQLMNVSYEASHVLVCGNSEAMTAMFDISSSTSPLAIPLILA